MVEYVVHIGPHKTGSTYLQSTFAARAEFLRGEGVLYPTDQGKPGHLQIPRKLVTAEGRAELAAQFRAYEAGNCAKVLLSAEDIGSMREPEIAAFRALVGNTAARIVFYCRSWAAVSLSNWGEQVRHGHATPLDVAMRQRMDAPNKSPGINYGTALGKFAAAFGKQSLALVSLEGVSEHKLDTAAHFAAAFLGIAALPSHDASDAPARNAALPLADAEIIRALNALRLERTQQRDGLMRRRYLRSATIQSQLAATLQAISQHRDTMVFDETTPKMLRLHDRLFGEYGNCLSPPSMHGRFFKPLARTMQFIRSDYLEIPQVREELGAAYHLLSAGQPQRRRAVANPEGC